MKTKLFLSILSMLTVGGLLFVACKGDEGPIGPAGAKGDKGDAGAAGAAGAKGDAGTANVIYSAWLPMPTQQDAATTTNAVKRYRFTVPQVTQAILDKGMAFFYISAGESSNPVALPHMPSVNNQGTIEGSYTCTAALLLGAVLYQEDWIGSGPIPASWINRTTTPYKRLRYVIIPGGIPAGRKAAVDYTNYEAVKKHYNLPD